MLAGSIGCNALSTALIKKQEAIVWASIAVSLMSAFNVATLVPIKLIEYREQQLETTLPAFVPALQLFFCLNRC